MTRYEHTDKDGDRIKIVPSHYTGFVYVDPSGLGVNVPRDHAEAIASAVAGEPVILIKESELPEVKVIERRWLDVDGYTFDDTAEDIESIRKEGFAYLAAARYLESQKSRNDEELDKLAEELQEAYLSTNTNPAANTWRVVARKAKELLADGS